MKTKKYRNYTILLLCCFIIFTSNNNVAAITTPSISANPVVSSQPIITVPVVTSQPIQSEIPTSSKPVLTDTPVPTYKPEFLEITSIENYDLLTSPIFISLNDTSDYEKKMEYLKSRLQNVTGYTSDYTTVSLTLDSLSTNQILLNESGTYEITANLKLNDVTDQKALISDDVPSFKIPVFILDSDYFHFDTVEANTDSINFNWSVLLSPEVTIQIYCNQYDSFDTITNQLSNYFFEISNFRNISNDTDFIESDHNHLSIQRNKLIKGKSYFFLVRYENTFSHIICITDNGFSISYQILKKPIYSSALNDAIPECSRVESAAYDLRDNPPEEPIIQNPPNVITETTTAASDTSSDTSILKKLKTIGTKKVLASEVTGNSMDVIQEEVTETKTKISGARLNYMFEIYPDYIPFEHQGILLRIPTEFLKSLAIADDSFLTVEIKKEVDNSFIISINLDDKEITDIPLSQIQFPIATDTRLMLLYNNKLMDTELTYSDHLVIFEINRTGFYTLKAKQDDITPKAEVLSSSLSNNQDSKFIISFNNTITISIIITLIIIASLVLIHKKRERKNHEL